MRPALLAAFAITSGCSDNSEEIELENKNNPKHKISAVIERNGHDACSSVLINSEWGLTSAHCWSTFTSKSTKVIFHDETTGNTETINVSLPDTDNDIAKLNRNNFDQVAYLHNNNIGGYDTTARDKILFRIDDGEFHRASFPLLAHPDDLEWSDITINGESYQTDEVFVKRIRQGNMSRESYDWQEETCNVYRHVDVPGYILSDCDSRSGDSGSGYYFEKNNQLHVLGILSGNFYESYTTTLINGDFYNSFVPLLEHTGRNSLTTITHIADAYNMCATEASCAQYIPERELDRINSLRNIDESIAPARQCAEIDVTTARIRQDATTNSQIVDKLSSGFQVAVTNDNAGFIDGYDWVEVEYTKNGNENTGYIASSLLSSMEPC